MNVEFNWAAFGALFMIAYALNIAAAIIHKRDLSADRFLLRGPIVALVATLIYGPVTVVFTFIAGVPLLVYLAWRDVTIGVMRGTHV